MIILYGIWGFNILNFLSENKEIMNSENIRTAIVSPYHLELNLDEFNVVFAELLIIVGFL